MGMQDFWNKARKFRPMDILERAQGVDGMPTGDDVIGEYGEHGIDYGKTSDIYKLGQNMMNRDSAYNQSIRANLESSSADAQAETFRQNQRNIAMGGNNMPTAAINAQNLQSANQAQAMTAQQFDQGQMAREQRGIGVLTGAMNNQAQLVQLAMGADQARNMAKTNAYRQGLGIMGNLFNMAGDTSKKAGMAMMGIPPVVAQRGGYMDNMKKYQKGGEVEFEPHMMYKDDDEMMAKTYKAHLSLKDKGYSHSKGMMYGGPVKKMQTGDFVKSGGLLGMIQGFYNKHKPDTSGGLFGMASRSAEDGMLSDIAMQAGKGYQKTADYLSPDQERNLDKINTRFGNYMDEKVTSDVDGATAVRRGDMWKGKALTGIGSILSGLGEGSKELSMPGYLMAKNLNLNTIGQQEGGYQEHSVLSNIPMRIGGGKIG
jgi:hypothetical protein